MEIIGVEIPPLNSHEILVRNEMTTLCRSDIATYSGKRIESTPTILGHEVVGRVYEFGANASRTDLRGTHLQIGDRVTWGIFASDPASEMSMRGMPQKGADRFKYGHERLAAGKTLHGGLSEFMILRPHTPIIKIAEEVPVPVAAITNCAVATVAGALRLAGSVKDRRVLISGAGMLGVLACAMAREAGARRVGAMDIDAGRLDMAKRFGADHTIKLPRDSLPPIEVESVHPNTIDHRNSVDIVIEASGVPSSMEKTLEMMAIGGIAVWIGAVSPCRPVNMQAEHIVRNLISIRGLHNYNTEDFRSAVEFIEMAHDVFPIRELIHDHFTLDRIDEAFRYAISINPFRVGVRL
jgi:putative phosphonate catabolism associated alcohol dehydrogenase